MMPSMEDVARRVVTAIAIYLLILVGGLIVTLCLIFSLPLDLVLWAMLFIYLRRRMRLAEEGSDGNNTIPDPCGEQSEVRV